MNEVTERLLLIVLSLIPISFFIVGVNVFFIQKYSKECTLAVTICLGGYLCYFLVSFALSFYYIMQPVLNIAFQPNQKNIYNYWGKTVNINKNKIGDIGEGAVVQQARDNATQTVSPSPAEKKESIFTNKYTLIIIAVLIVIGLYLGSVTFLCNNKILSDKSCRILLQETVKVFPTVKIEENKKP